jgi:hypothetical protein
VSLTCTAESICRKAEYLTYQSNNLPTPNSIASHINPFIRKNRKPAIPIFLNAAFIFSLLGKNKLFGGAKLKNKDKKLLLLKLIMQGLHC